MLLYFLFLRLGFFVSCDISGKIIEEFEKSKEKGNPVTADDLRDIFSSNGFKSTKVQGLLGVGKMGVALQLESGIVVKITTCSSEQHQQAVKIAQKLGVVIEGECLTREVVVHKFLTEK